VPTLTGSGPVIAVRVTGGKLAGVTFISRKNNTVALWNRSVLV
jgi:hypothetical protein